MEFLQQHHLVKQGGIIGDLSAVGAGGGSAVRRVPSSSSSRRPYVSSVSELRDARRLASVATSPSSTSAASERRSRTHEDMRNFVSGMTRQQYYFGAPAAEPLAEPPPPPLSPLGQVGSGFVSSNGAFINGVVELSRRPDAGSRTNGRYRDRRRRAVEEEEAVDALPPPPPELLSPSLSSSSSSSRARPGRLSPATRGPPPPPPPPASAVPDDEDAVDAEVRAVERLFREAMAMADSRSKGGRALPPARTLWEPRREVRKQDEVNVCAQLLAHSLKLLEPRRSITEASHRLRIRG